MTRTFTPQQKIALSMFLSMALIRIADQSFGHLLPHSFRYLPLILIFAVAAAGTLLLFRISPGKMRIAIVAYILIFIALIVSQLYFS